MPQEAVAKGEVWNRLCFGVKNEEAPIGGFFDQAGLKGGEWWYFLRLALTTSIASKPYSRVYLERMIIFDTAPISLSTITPKNQ